MSRCKGPNAGGVEWSCDMQHGLVEGRCATCHVMAEAASNLNVEQMEAVRLAVLKSHDWVRCSVCEARHDQATVRRHTERALPAWADAAFRLVGRLTTAGIGIRALRLTPEQADDLRAYTSRTDLLLGYPVSIKEAA